MIDKHVAASLITMAKLDGTAIISDTASMLNVKLVARNKDGNTFFLLTRDGMKPIPPDLCYAWGAAVGVPSGTEWHFVLKDTAAYCEFACMFPAAGKVVQP